MKKFICILIATIISLGACFVLASCDKKQEKQEEEENYFMPPKPDVEVELSDYDRHLLSYYHDPAEVDEAEFEYDNIVRVTLKSAFNYLYEFNFSELWYATQVAPISYVVSAYRYTSYVSSYIETYYSASGAFLLKRSEDEVIGPTSAIKFIIVFDMHSKKNLVKICEILNQSEKILCATPIYRVYAVDT